MPCSHAWVLPFAANKRGKRSALAKAGGGGYGVVREGVASRYLSASPFISVLSLPSTLPANLASLLPDVPTYVVSQERSLTAADFALFAACGAIGCTTTHLTVIPLDVVKTRLQTDPGKYTGLTEGVTTIAKEVSRMLRAS